MRFALPLPQRSQPLLLRIATTVIGVLCLATLVVFGTLALAILVVGGLVWLIGFRWHLYRLRRQAARGPQEPAQARDPDIIDGDYVVVREHHENAH